MNTDTSAPIPGPLGASLASTLQHIELLREKELKLEAARLEAENQLLYNIGAAFRAGDINHAQLITAFDQYRALALTGRLHRWDAHVDIEWKSMCHLARQIPNGPEGSWVGEYPFTDDTSAPKSGIAVVYVLFDETNEPCYVGSTHTFRARMAHHRRNGKAFTSWQAHPCRDREHAFVLEDRLLKEYLPRLNRKASR